MTPARGSFRPGAPRSRIFSLAASLLAVAALAACASGTPRPDPAPLPANIAQIGVGQAWTAKIPAVSFPLQVNVLGSRVTLASDDGTVLKLDAATGRELSRSSVGEPLAAGVGSDGRVDAVVTRANQVVALEGGREIWRRKLKSQSYTAPLVAGGRVFILGADRSLTAFDGSNGAELWHMTRPAEPLVLRQAGVLLAVGDTLIAGLAGRLVGVDPDTGSVHWEAPVGTSRGTNDVERLVDLVGGVSRQGSEICARSFQTAVGCVNADTGTLRWSKPANGATGVAGDGELVFGAEADGKVLAWRAISGERAWINESLQWRVLSGPLVLGRSVIIGDSTGLVHMLSREDGSALNRLTTDTSGVAATPVVAADTLVVVTRSGGVFGFVPE